MLVDVSPEGLLILLVQVLEIGLHLEELDYGLLDICKSEKLLHTHTDLIIDTLWRLICSIWRVFVGIF